MRKCIVSVCRLSCLTFLVLVAFSAPARAEGESRPLVMESVVVTGTRTEHKLSDVPVQTYVITNDVIEASDASTLSELLNTIPGFNFTQQANVPGAMGYKNTVRGLSVESRYLLVLVDGRRVFTGYRAGGMTGAGAAHNVNAVPLEMIDHVEIVNGPSSALYGSDAVVGVLNIITKQSDASTSAGAGFTSYEVKGRDFTHVKPSKRYRKAMDAYSLVAGKVFETMGAMLFVNHQENDGIKAEKFDTQINTVSGKVDWQVLPELSVNFGAEYAYWHEENDGKTSVNKETSPRMFASMLFEPNSEHSLTLDAYTQRLMLQLDDAMYGDPESKVGYDSASMQYTYSGFEDIRFVFGGEFLRESFKDDTISKAHRDTKSVYGQMEWAFFDGKLVAIPGVRIDNNNEYGTEFNPKFSLMYRPLLDTTFRASIGRAFKAPSPSQTHASPINMYTLYGVSNRDLEPEKSVTWQIGAEQFLFDRKLRLSATYFDIRVEDLIVTVATGDTLHGLPVTTYDNVEEARIRGVESSLDYFFLNNWKLSSNYTYTSARNKTTGKRLKDVPRHMVSASVTYDNPDWRLGVSLFGTYSDSQYNLEVMPGMTPEKTAPYTSIGLTAWKEIGDGLKFKATAANIFDETMTDSDTIHLGRSISFNVEYTF